MLTTAPHLRIRRPSPTTAEFTVTTRPPSTLPLHLLLFGVLLARLSLATSALLLLHSAWLSSPFASPPPRPLPHARPPLLSDDFLWWLAQQLHSSAPGAALARLAAAVPAWALVPGCAAALWVAALRVHATESVLVLRGLGIQTASSGSSYLPVGGSGGGTRFIPTEKIRDVLINEAFRGFEVRYYLIVVVEGEEDVIVVFPRLLPRRAIVEKVWRGVRGCLYEGDGRVAKVDEKG